MKNLTFTEKLRLIIILLICASLLFLFSYKQSSSSVNIHIQKVNSSSVDRKLLIAAPSSPFKDSIKVIILDRYKSPSIVVKVIDIKVLDNTKIADFDAILIMHRWEAGAPTDNVKLFMDENVESKNKIVMLTTSWDGLEKMEHIDAITGASIVKDVPIFTEKIINRLDRLLKFKN